MDTSITKPSAAHTQPWSRWASGKALLGAFAWLAFFLAVSTIGWSSLFHHLEKTKQEAIQRALTDASRAASGYASYLQQSLTAIDQLSLTIRYSWERTNGELSLEEMLRRGIFIDPQNFYVGIFGPDGQLLTNTVPGSPSINASRAPFFHYLKTTAFDALYVDKPGRGTFTKRQVVRFARRLTGHDGTFAGMEVVSVTPEYFTANYESMGLGNHDVLAVFGEDGVVRATRVGNDVKSVTGMPFLQSAALTGTRGQAVWNGTNRFADGRTRYVGWAAVASFPMIALVGLDSEDALVPYARYRSRSVRDAMLVNATFALFTLIGMGLSLRLSWRKHVHEQLQATYRLATESAAEGFYILEPVHTVNGTITDFTFIDCNQRGAQFMSTDPRHIIGRTLSSCYGGQIPEQVMQMLSMGMEHGEYETELQISAGSPFKAEWMHSKLVRSDGRLALALRDVSGTKAHVHELERRSNEDALTGLPNRHWLNDYLPKAVTSATEQHAMLAILFIDLDGFKRVNDMMGHAVGDELLRNAGRRLKLAVRPADHVVRMGGDEFVVVVERIHSSPEAAHIAQRILRAFEEGFRLSQGIHRIGTSIGISIFPHDGADAAQLVKHADIAMYSVKSAGKRNFRFYDRHFDNALNARHHRELELRHALEAGQLIMYYQPRIDVTSGRTSSMEALVRWAHPVKGIIEPNEFIPLAEETGLIVDLGRQVIDKVCAQIAAWMRQGQALVPVSINISARQFDEANVAQLLSASIAQHGIEAGLVELELTESTMSRNSENVSETLALLQDMGVKLSVDDFGTGYSSLSQLQRLDFDVLKVDRAFTAQLKQSREGSALFRAIITMAHELGMRVVAEGVETVEQFKTLSAMHCDEIQGFFVSRPLPPAERQQELLRDVATQA